MKPETHGAGGKGGSMKRTLTVTFDEEEWAMFDRADASLKNWFSETFNRRWRQWLIRRAVYAVAREMAQQHEIVLPIAVTLRTETRGETDERCGWTGKESIFAGARAFVPVHARISPEAEAVFRQWNESVFKGDAKSIDGAVGWLLNYVAAHLDQFRPNFEKFADYCAAEGLDQSKCLASICARRLAGASKDDAEN